MKAFRDFFLYDQQGSVSLWNLFWFLGFCIILGLAVDTTGAMHTKAKLQSVADASSHAGVVDIFPIPTDSYTAAVAYGGYNISTSNVVRNQDVTLGYWDDDARTFNADVNAIPYYNAVKVNAARDTSRANALATNLLQIVGLKNWDIAVASIARYSDDLEDVDDCRLNGLVAGDEMNQQANNTISNMCIHGEGNLRITQNNIVTCDSMLSTPSPDNWQTGQPPSGYEGSCSDDYLSMTNEEMMNQSTHWRSLKSNAQAEYDNVKRFLEAFVAGAQINDPFVNTIPPYIETVAELSVQQFNQLSKVNGGGSHSLVPGTLYKVMGCSPNGGKKLKLEGIVQNIGIYTDCEIDVVKNQDVSAEKPTKTATGTPVNCDPDPSICENVEWDIELVQPMYDCDGAIAAGFESYTTMLDTAPGETYRDGETTDTIAQDCGIEPGANGLFDNVFIFTTRNEDGNRDQRSISFPNNMQIGRLDGCNEGGGVRMYLGGSMATPSGTIIHGTHIFALGDVDLAAKANGSYGVTVEAGDDITYAAQGTMIGCPGDEDGVSDLVLTVFPIAIVD